jgi:hypothetical protein
VIATVAMTMHFSRHGDWLEITAVVVDPVYLTGLWRSAGCFGKTPAPT